MGCLHTVSADSGVVLTRGQYAGGGSFYTFMPDQKDDDDLWSQV